MQCLQMCVSQFARQEEKRAEQGVESDSLPESVEEAQELLQSLVDRMVETNLEDFELVSCQPLGEGGSMCMHMYPLQDRSADYSTSSSVGQKNRVFANLVMGLYEVCDVRVLGTVCFTHC